MQFRGGECGRLSGCCTEGELWVEPGVGYYANYKLRVKVNGVEEDCSFDKVDQFGAEIEYFSRCILNNVEPEPCGYEGLADVRVIEALLQSMRSGSPVKLERFEKKSRPGEQQ